jgi:nitric-oxide synthase
MDPLAAPLSEARALLEQLRQERGLLDAPGVEERLDEIRAELAAAGSYRQTFDELEFGARIAWRNSVRCVGRSYWPTLEVVDARDLRAPEEIFEALVDHLVYSTNNGRIRPRITVFAPRAPGRPDIRLWNDQLIRYAGYRQADGSILGDPQQADLTGRLLRLGWIPPADRGGVARSRFDVLPLVIQIGAAPPRVFDLPPGAVLEVPISHPDHAAIGYLGLRWHALPAVANMCLDSGGLLYPSAPFSGWYMGAEIAARNFADEGRYNQLPAVADMLGLDRRREETLWRDRALVELNVAVLWSFQQAGVKMVDHHTVTRHFVGFEEREERKGRPTHADWSWLIPPLSASATPVYHRHYEDLEIKPNYFYQESAWREAPGAPDYAECPFRGSLPNR